MSQSWWRVVGTAVFIGALMPAMARAQSPASPQQEIQPLLDRQMDAANAHDTDRFLADYVHDATLVLVFNGTVTTGYDDVRALQLKWWNNGKSDVAYSLRGPALFSVLAPDVVVVTAPMASVRTGPDGAQLTGAFTATSVWQKRAEGWKVAVVHESTVR